MAKVTRTFEIAAPADDVWDLVSGFQSMDKWHPLIKSSKAKEGGRTRNLGLKNGGYVRERLLKYDHKARSLTYTITEGTVPLTDYVSTISVKPKGKKACVVTWTGSYTPKGAPAAECAKLVATVYEAGRDGIKKKLNVN
jgi:carbon monoxide dehydrogenase subunit G